MRFIRLYGRVIAVLGRDRRIAALLMAANLLVAALVFIEPVLFGRVIEMLMGAASRPAAELWRDAILLLGTWAVVGMAGIAANIAASLQSERLAHRNRLFSMRRFYEHVLSLPPSFHGQAHSGRLMKVMSSGADTMFWLWLGFFRDQLAVFLAVLVLLPLTLLINWRLALVLIVLVVAFSALMLLVITRTEAGQSRAQHWQIALVGAAQDALANVTVVQSFARLPEETRRFAAIVSEVIAHQFPVLNWWALANVMTRAGSTVAVIAIVVAGTIMHVRGQASVGEVVGFMGFATLLVARLDGAMAFLNRLFLEVPGLTEFFAVLDAETSVPAGGLPLRVEAGEVVFEDVAFRYPGGPVVLAGVSFTAAPGRVVALVGHTGAGKSTATALLQRFWDPDAGRILIDGQDLRDVTLDSLRRAIGVVFQDAMLLNRSIRDNLLFGRPDADQAALEAACIQAEAHEFILAQPSGYDTLVGERGATLSGGQRQRLAIARALLKDPPILVLDEATSALDAATEARVTAALRRLMAGRTTFIIAHRLSTVVDADEILVFDAGRIVERGSYAELIAAEGQFSALVSAQILAHASKR